MNKSEIKKLQKKANRLEVSAKERDKLTEQAIRYGENFLENLPAQKAFVQTDKKASLPSFSDEPTSFDQLLSVLHEEVDSNGLNPPSGNHLGYIPAGGLYPSALGDFLAAVTNRYAGSLYNAPGAVRMENQCLRWLCDLIGYPEGAGGNLTSGGSIANLIGMANARDHSGITPKNYEKAVIYTTHQVHHCVIKAIKFTGLHAGHLRLISMDDRFRMQAEALQQQIEQDLEQGLKPLIIFASAGTTDLGAVDPLQAISKIALKYKIWLHVDAAYGGAFLLTEHGQQKMEGIRNADSVTIDPHKGFFLPYGTGALLVSDVEKLYESQHMAANYMQDTVSVEQEYSPADLSPELSKHFRGLRMWLPLQLFGIEPFRAALNEKLLLTRYFYEKIQQIEGIKVGPEPELSILIFRYIPASGKPNQFNKKLIKAIHDDGRVYLTSTTIDDTFYIRLAVLNFRTHLETMDKTIVILKEKIAKLT